MSGSTFGYYISLLFAISKVRLYAEGRLVPRPLPSLPCEETEEWIKELYVRLGKTKRINGRALLGQHAVHLPLEN